MNIKNQSSHENANAGNHTHRRKKSEGELCLYEYTAGLSQIPSVIAHLDAVGMEMSYAVFTIETPVVTEDQSDNVINIQYAIEGGIVGLEWPLIRQRNIADKQQLVDFILQRGFKIAERVQKFTEPELVDLHYIRVEEGDIAYLGNCILTELYQLESNAVIPLLTDGFERPNLKMNDVISFVRQSVNHRGFISDVERVSAVLRMIHGKSRIDNVGDLHEAFASLETFHGFIRFADVFDDKSYHSLWSEIPAESRAQIHKEYFIGGHEINLLSACGYHRVYSRENNYEKWFSVATDNEFRELAEFCVGILHVLFDHQLGHPLEINFFMPGPDVDKLLKAEDLPKPMQASYATFMSDVYGALAQYHKMMAIESPRLTKQQEDELIEVFAKMENSLDEFPSWISKLKKLSASYAKFYSCATDHQTELIESLYVLRRQYKMQIFH